MKKNNLIQVGGLLSILVGVSYLVIGLTFLLLPSAQRPGGSSDFVEYMESVAQGAALSTINNWAYVIVAILALGVIPAVPHFIKGRDNGWLPWASNLAYLGFAVVALTFLRFIVMVPVEADAFVQSDELSQLVIGWDNFHLGLDPDGWLSFGAVGFWVLVVSLISLSRKTMTAIWSYLGIATAVLYWLAVAGNVFNVGLLLLVSVGLGVMILSPIWYIWLGFRMRQSGDGEV